MIIPKSAENRAQPSSDGTARASAGRGACRGGGRLALKTWTAKPTQETDLRLGAAKAATGRSETFRRATRQTEPPWRGAEVREMVKLGPRTDCWEIQRKLVNQYWGSGRRLFCKVRAAPTYREH